MKQFIFAISLGAMIFISFNVVNATSYGNSGDPHDSLLYDGDLQGIEIPISLNGFDDCSIRVTKVKGKAIGKVFQVFLSPKGCEKGYDTTYREVERQLVVGDILVEGASIETGGDGFLEMGYFISADLLKKNFPAMTSKVGNNTKIEVPYLYGICMELDIAKEKVEPEVLIIKGKVEYEGEDDELTPLPKIKTKGKRSSVKHTKTKYTHEVRVDGNDTVDVINVYNGEVEVTYFRSDYSDMEENSQDFEQLYKDFSEGRITAEELAEKMTKFTNKTDEMFKLMDPVIVSEGNKCVVTKSAINVEAGTESNNWSEE